MTPRTLDIRDIPQARGEPFTSIMAAIDALAPRQSLLLIAPFKPEPLLRLLDGRGFDNAAISLPDGTWQVLFTPRQESEPAVDPADPLTWPKPAALLDLSGTAPDEAAGAVLTALDGLTPGQVLFALLSSEPADLVGRLIEQGHACFGRWQDESYRIMVLSGGAPAP